MLVRFSVKNFRSFRTEQVLSLEAGRQTIGRGHRTVATGCRSAPRLLKAAVIYGANSGGKSNLVRAMGFLHEFVENSAREGQKGDLVNVEPYRLDRVCIDQPSEFEIVFISNGSMYQYGLATDEHRVHAEWLYETPREGRIRHIFNRELSAKGRYEWYVNPRVKGEKKLWQDATRENASFLSTAIQLNSEDLAVPFEWVTDKLRVILGKELLSQSYTSHVCHEHDRKSAVLQILQSVDPEVIDLKTTEEEFSENAIPDDMPPELRAELIKSMKGRTFYDAEIVRRGIAGAVAFDLEDESTGTNLLYNLAGPWLDSLCYGYTMVVDELDSGLHPLALRTLVSMFFDETINTGGAQLIITCHESTLLRDELLRPDQVWFIDRDFRRGSRLYPLSEFKPRQNESFFKGYLSGRYGGLPLTRAPN